MQSANRILFVAPHPDDETLGCGGSILKHRAAGDMIYWLIMTTMFPGEKNSYGRANYNPVP